jgi:uncharacterized YigZ family protein
VRGRYRTIVAETRHEIAKIKGSRFIGTAGPFTDEAGLAKVIDLLRDDFPEANHHCFAWRAGDRFRASDDGEPSGTAGRPILQRIDGSALDHVFVVVTRIFGGTKLGAGGLVRAYSAAAGAVLEVAPQVEVVPTSRVRITIPYDLQGILESVIVAHGLARLEATFAATVTLVLAVPLEQVDTVLAEFNERTAGRAIVTVS